MKVLPRWLQDRKSLGRDHDVREHFDIPAEVLADRDRRKGLRQRSLVAALCGDPLPGYAALDRQTIQRGFER